MNFSVSCHALCEFVHIFDGNHITCSYSRHACQHVCTVQMMMHTLGHMTKHRNIATERDGWSVLSAAWPQPVSFPVSIWGSWQGNHKQHLQQRNASYLFPNPKSALHLGRLGSKNVWSRKQKTQIHAFSQRSFDQHPLQTVKKNWPSHRLPLWQLQGLIADHSYLTVKPNIFLAHGGRGVFQHLFK